VRHRLADAQIPEDLGKARVRVARVQKERLAELRGKLELRHEPFLLAGVRRVVAVEIQPAFAERHDPRSPGHFPQRGNRRVVALARMVRMHAGGGVQAVRVGDVRGTPAFLHRGARDDDALDAMRVRTGQHGVEIVAERRVRQVGPDVHELHGAIVGWAGGPPYAWTGVLSPICWRASVPTSRSARSVRSVHR
jgi:hypothetical protein